MKTVWKVSSASAAAVLVVFFVTGIAAISSPLREGDDDGPRFSDWGTPVNLGPILNSTSNEFTPAISKDGRSLYFSSNRPGGFGGLDIWVSQRASVEDPWGPPQNLGPNINTSFNDAAPNFSRDGHLLFFQSNRPGGFGGQDLYASWRRNKRDDFAWQLPDNLGSGVNSASNEIHAMYFEDDETDTTILYFVSNRPGGLGSNDIYASTRNDDDEDQTFGPAVLVEELSSPFDDQSPAIRRDGLEIFIASDRPPNLGLFTDIWVATRASTSDPWSAPSHLGSTVNNGFNEGARSLSARGTELYFNGEARPGNLGGNDLYVTTRTRIRHRERDRD